MAAQAPISCWRRLTLGAHKGIVDVPQLISDPIEPLSDAIDEVAREIRVVEHLGLQA